MKVSETCCGCCCFTNVPGEEAAGMGNCKISNDPVVQETYSHIRYVGNSSIFAFDAHHVSICGKFQLNPAALEN